MNKLFDQQFCDSINKKIGSQVGRKKAVGEISKRLDSFYGQSLGIDKIMRLVHHRLGDTKEVTPEVLEAIKDKI